MLFQFGRNGEFPKNLLKASVKTAFVELLCICLAGFGLSRSLTDEKKKKKVLQTIQLSAQFSPGIKEVKKNYLMDTVNSALLIKFLKSKKQKSD